MIRIRWLVVFLKSSYISIFTQIVVQNVQRKSVCKKNANCVLGMIKRNIKCKNAAAIIMRLYKSVVRLRLKYCILAGPPYHKKDIEVLERVQKRATQMVYGYGDLNYKDRLSLLELPSLEERRVRGDLIEAFKLLREIIVYF